jgi:RNA polymerase sigma-70 factor (ECF subfamily)
MKEETDAMGLAATAALDERTLLDSWSGGDQGALARLVESTYRDVFAALCRFTGGDADLAADLTQETYRKAWQALGEFRGEAAFSTWLHRIAWTTFLNHVRRPRPVSALDDVAPIADGQPDALTTSSQREEAERLRRAVLGLPEPLRSTVAARFWSELPVAEIARLESITTVAVRKRLDKAFGSLRAVLEGSR